MSLRTSTEFLDQINNYEPKKLTAPRLRPIAKNRPSKRSHKKIEIPMILKNKKLQNELINRKNEEIFI